jgi:hypothetical protein
MHPDRVEDRFVELSDESRLSDHAYEVGDLELKWCAFVALARRAVAGPFLCVLRG